MFGDSQTYNTVLKLEQLICKKVLKFILYDKYFSDLLMRSKFDIENLSSLV